MAFAATSLVAAAVTAIVYLFRGTYFRPYFGDINPLLAIALAIVCGGISLRFLKSRGWFAICAKGKTLRGVILSAAFTTAFAAAIILLDLVVGFPRDLNVPAPWSLLFYPAMAYVVETLLHALPIALLLALFGKRFKSLRRDRLVWIFIVIVSLIEPIFQLRAGFAGQTRSWLDAYVGLHVFAFNLVELGVFRRYGFISMLSFRLIYYLYWHILWGYIRLQLLF